jgi:hypothetical protein
MSVQMPVPFPVKQEYPAKHQNRGKPVWRRRAFAEQDDRQQRADKRPNGKKSAGPG